MKCLTTISSFLLLSCLFFYPIIGYCQTNSPTVSFQVCDIDENERSLSQFPALYTLEKKVVEPEWCYNWIQEQDSSITLPPKRRIETFYSLHDSLLISNFHPFVEAVHLSYAQHRPLVLSPDMIWLLLCQGFAQHRAVKNKKNPPSTAPPSKNNILHITLDQLNNDWQQKLPEFSLMIQSTSNYKLYNSILADFSTTGLTEKIAFELTLMDVKNKQFVFSINTFCGIPSITLEGTVDDWLQLEKKAQRLSSYDLKWWTKDLKYILRQFTRASQNKVNKHFWKDMYKWHTVGSGNPYITGWLNRLFPYLGHHKSIHQNPIIGKNPKQFTQRALRKAENGNIIPFNRYIGPKITTKDFPSGLSKMAFTAQTMDNEPTKMEFIAGFVGISQNKQTKHIRPEIGWIIVELEEVEKNEKFNNTIFQVDLHR